MSLTLIRPYLRARLDSLDLKEWDDAFNVENIPESVLDQAYHIGPPEINNVSIHQNTLQTDTTILIRVFIKGFRTPKNAIDDGTQMFENICSEVLDPVNRLTQGQGFKNILLTTANIEAMAVSNDNIALLTIGFRCMVFMDVC